MNPIPQTETIIAFYFDNDITSIIYDYLLFNLHTQKEYAIYGIHEALKYPSDVILYMLDVFDDDIVFDIIVLYNSYVNVYTGVILANHLNLATRIAYEYKKIYGRKIQKEIDLAMDTFMYENPRPINENIEPNCETIDYLMSTSVNIKTSAKFILCLLFLGYIKYETILNSKKCRFNK